MDLIPWAAAFLRWSQENMNEIMPGLFVGNISAAEEVSKTTEHKITHVLSVLSCAIARNRYKEYYCIEVRDRPDTYLTKYFQRCNDFIHGARVKGGNVLIHCYAGKSRSVTIAAAYIMSTENLSHTDALNMIRRRRSKIRPNWGFMRQLHDFNDRRHVEWLRLNRKYPNTLHGLLSTDVNAEHERICGYTEMERLKDKMTPMETAYMFFNFVIILFVFFGLVLLLKEWL